MGVRIGRSGVTPSDLRSPDDGFVRFRKADIDPVSGGKALHRAISRRHISGLLACNYTPTIIPKIAAVFTAFE